MSDRTYQKMVPLEAKTNKLTNRYISDYFDKCHVFSVPLKDSMDLNEATDALVIPMYSSKILRCAKRVRRHDYLFHYSDEFTIRSTELPKILAGHADYMFYFFLTEDLLDVERYFAINLDEFRIKYDPLFGNKFENPDGDDSSFVAFKIYHFKKAITTMEPK